MTLDDVERPKRHSCRNKSYRAHPKSVNEDRPILSAEQCRPMILVFRNKSYMWIFKGVPRRGALRVILTSKLLKRTRVCYV